MHVQEQARRAREQQQQQAQAQSRAPMSGKKAQRRKLSTHAHRP
jgi:hypothetical protein